MVDARPSRHTRLDLWFERVLGDHGSQHFGSGWFSGLTGLLLSLGSFCAVLVFQFPEWLTMSDIRSRHPVEFMRGLLTLAIIAGFFFSALNIMLRPSKTLGLAGLAFSTLAVLLGGAGVEVDWHGAAPVSIGSTGWS